jgi:hypothetical protein
MSQHLLVCAAEVRGARMTAMAFAAPLGGTAAQTVCRAPGAVGCARYVVGGVKYITRAASRRCSPRPFVAPHLAVTALGGTIA